MILNFELESRNREFSVSFNEGMSVDLGNDVHVNYRGTIVRKGFDFPLVMEWALKFGTDVGTGVVAALLVNWLSSLKGKGKVETIKFESKVIELDDNEK